MKKIVTFLVLCLILSGCVSRVDPPEPKSVVSEPVSENTSSNVEIPEESKPSHAINDPEEISETISIVADLLKNAKECNLIYTGSMAIDSNIPAQTTDGTANYNFVNSKYKAISDIEKLWTNTFIPEGKARECYEKMIEDKLYASFNGELYMKEHSDLPPMTMGEWNLDSIIIKTVEDDQIIVEMETTIVGQPNGMQKLALFNVDGNWLLSDSYFLD